jgi:tetratricopeptide (TPR) repeat protein
VVIWKTNVNVVRADTYYNWGIAYEESGQWDTAVALYRRAIAIAPAQARYYTFLGGAYGTRAVEEGNPDSPLFRETEAALRRARDLSPLDPDHWANLGRLYQSWALLTEEPEPRLVRLNAALESYERATTLSPNNHGRRLKDNVVETYLMLGDHHLTAGDIEPAAQAYSQALERDSQAALDKKLQTTKNSPQSPTAHESLALIYAQMGRTEDAMNHLQRAMELATADQRITLERLAAFLQER